MNLDQLKEAGFNDQEIKNYVNEKSGTLLNAGFNEQEVNQYFGIKEPDRKTIQDYWQGIKQTLKDDLKKEQQRKIDINQKVKETLVGKEFDPKV